MTRCEFPECIAPAAVELTFDEIRDVANGEPARILFCRGCFDAIDSRLDRVRVERDGLIAQGVERRMADHIMGARVDRKEI